MQLALKNTIQLRPVPSAKRAELPALSDDELVNLAQLGSEHAFQELMCRSRETCVRMAMAILRSRDDAEDEVQNAFWKAYTHLGLFNRQSTFSTWVTRIVINHCLMRYRRARRLQFVSYDAVSPDGDWYVAYQPTTTDTPEQGLGDSEIKQVLLLELGRIPILLRTPLELRYVNDLSLEDVARRLGISVAATKSRLHRAQTYLRDRMLRHCGIRGPASLVRAS